MLENVDSFKSTLKKQFEEEYSRISNFDDFMKYTQQIFELGQEGDASLKIALSLIK